MSNRIKKTKADQSKAGSNGPHITRISASSGNRKDEPSTKSDASAKPNTSVEPTVDNTATAEISVPDEVFVDTGVDADTVEPELVVTDTGKTEAQMIDKADKELNTPKKLSRKERKALKKSQKSDQERPVKSYFLLWRPFVALGRYLRDSWREIRQVRWPNRKATWQMTLAVLVYCALFMVFLTLLDVFFTFIFDKIFQ